MHIDKRNYSPEIDGLRAISVIFIILYHSSSKLFSGGYIGVDIFFVISGYLITNLIYSEIQINSFSILNFYERRIRRLLPSLLFMIIIITLLCYKYCLPRELSEFGRSFSAMAIFLVNVFFYRNYAGYFDTLSDTKPLLHAWSLSIEEQFYFFIPLVIIIIYKIKKKYLIIAIGGLFIVSFIASVLMIYNDQRAVFYLLQYRAWELLAGVLLATWPKFRDHKWKQVTINVLSVIAVLFIMIPVFCYTNRTVFPGLAVAPAIIGAVILIQLGANGIIGKILSKSILVFIGKISYPLYLWHWPLLAILKIHLARSLTTLETLICIIVSFLLAIFSFYIVERPIRSKSILKKQSYIFVFAVTYIVFFGVGGRLIKIFNGFEYRYSSQILSYEKNKDIPHFITEPCSIIYNSKEYFPCILGDKNNNQPLFIIWGDSHAGVWSPGVDEIAKEYSISGLRYSTAFCPPVLDLDIKPEFDQIPVKCIDFNDGIIPLVKKYDIKHVAIAAIFGARLGGLTRKLNAPRVFTDQFIVFRNKFNNTVKVLNELGVTVWIVEGIPMHEFPVPDRIIRAILAGKDINSVALDYKIHENFYWPVLNILDYVKKNNNNVRFLMIEPPICNKNICSPGDKNMSYYLDDHHLSISGSIYFKNTFKLMMETIAKENMDPS
ncbi:MAG: acyltransferase [Rickettsiales bacterium]|jgi:peptidoglycan/LPS O-acetylase OafA/YrhL|nr:acyltransferase [Rickettsiales bacterium]